MDVFKVRLPPEEHLSVQAFCMVQQLLYIGKSRIGKIPHTWHF